MKILKSNNTTQDKESDSSIFKSHYYSNKNSKVAPREQPDSLPSAANQHPGSKAERLQELVPSDRLFNRSIEDASDSAEEDIGSGSPAINTARKHGESFSVSELDKKLLKSLLYSDGKLSCLALSRKMEIPYTTIYRRRKRLEGEFLERSYSLRLGRFGWRTADLLVSTHKGMSAIIGKELLDLSSITRVHRTIGEHTIDLHAETVFRNNKELLNVIEWVKSLDGVENVVWTEPVELVGRNTSVQYEIIDNHS